MQDTLILGPKVKMYRIPFVIKFKDTLLLQAKIIKNRSDILKVKLNLKDIFPRSTYANQSSPEIWGMMDGKTMLNNEKNP